MSVAPRSAGTPGLPDPAARAERAARDDALASALRLGGLPRFLDQWYQLPMWAPLLASPRCAGAGWAAVGIGWGPVRARQGPYTRGSPAELFPATARARRFGAMLQQRQACGDAAQLAEVLSAASPGRAPSLWRELEEQAAAGTLPPLLLVAGQADAKFVGIAERLAARLAAAGGSADGEAEEGDWQEASIAGDGGSGEVGAAAAAAEVVLLPGCGHAVHIERPAELLAAMQRFSRRLQQDAC